MTTSAEGGYRFGVRRSDWGRSVTQQMGVLDQPFATTQKTLSRVIGVRDAQGAIRYLDHGNLPFTRDIVQFHKEKIAERAKKEGREISYDAVVGDIFALTRGSLISSPSWQAEELGASTISARPPYATAILR